MSADEPLLNQPSAAPKPDWNAFATAQAERIEPTANLIGKAVKIGASLTSIPTALGGLLLVSYIHSAGAPLPPLDASSGLFLIILALVCIIALTIVSAFFILPLIQKAQNAEVVSKVLPGLYISNPIRTQWFGFMRAYGFLFIPLFLGLIIQVIYSLSLSKAIRAHPQVAFLPAGLFMLQAVWVRLQEHLPFKDLWLFIEASFIANCVSFVWMLVFLLFQLIVIERTWTSLDEVLASYVFVGCLALLLVIHFALYSGKMTLFSASAVCFLLFLSALLIYPGMSFLGGTALHYLGVGGTFPVSLTLKGDTGENPRSVKGCLIISVGNQVSISVGDSPKEDEHPNCRLEPKFSDSQTAPRKQSVKTFQRADILDLEALPEISASAKK